jgi:hypothetical protein
MRTKAQKRSGMHEVMGEFKRGALHSGSKTGPTVTNRKQAIAIGLSQTGQSKYAEGGIVDHDFDRDLPRKQDDAQLVPLVQYPPAYLQTIDHLLANQRRLQGFDQRLPGIEPPKRRDGGDTPSNFFRRRNHEVVDLPRPRRRRRGPDQDGIEELFDTQVRGQRRPKYLQDGGGGGDAGGGDAGAGGCSAGGGCGCTGDSCGGGACGGCSCSGGGCSGCGIGDTGAGAGGGGGNSGGSDGGGGGCSAAAGDTGGGCFGGGFGAAAAAAGGPGEGQGGPGQGQTGGQAGFGQGGIGSTTGTTGAPGAPGGPTGDVGNFGNPSAAAYGISGISGAVGNTGYAAGLAAQGLGAMSAPGDIAAALSAMGMPGAQAAAYGAYASVGALSGGFYGGDLGVGMPGTSSFGAEGDAGGGGTNGLGNFAGALGAAEAAAGGLGGGGGGSGGGLGGGNVAGGNVAGGGALGGGALGGGALGGQDDQGGGGRSGGPSPGASLSASGLTGAVSGLAGAMTAANAAPGNASLGAAPGGGGWGTGETGVGNQGAAAVGALGGFGGVSDTAASTAGTSTSSDTGGGGGGTSTASDTGGEPSAGTSVAAAAPAAADEPAAAQDDQGGKGGGKGAAPAAEEVAATPASLEATQAADKGDKGAPPSAGPGPAVTTSSLGDISDPAVATPGWASTFGLAGAPGIAAPGTVSTDPLSGEPTGYTGNYGSIGAGRGGPGAFGGSWGSLGGVNAALTGLGGITGVGESPGGALGLGAVGAIGGPSLGITGGPAGMGGWSAGIGDIGEGTQGFGISEGQTGGKGGPSTGSWTGAVDNPSMSTPAGPGDFGNFGPGNTNPSTGVLGDPNQASLTTDNTAPAADVDPGFESPASKGTPAYSPGQVTQGPLGVVSGIAEPGAPPGAAVGQTQTSDPTSDPDIGGPFGANPSNYGIGLAPAATQDPGPDARGALSGLAPAANAITGAIESLGYTGVAHGAPALAAPAVSLDPYVGMTHDEPVVDPTVPVSPAVPLAPVAPPTFTPAPSPFDIGPAPSFNTPTPGEANLGGGLVGSAQAANYGVVGGNMGLAGLTGAPSAAEAVGAGFDALADAPAPSQGLTNALTAAAQNMAAPGLAAPGQIGGTMSGFEGPTPGAVTSFAADPSYGFSPGAFTGQPSLGYESTQGKGDRGATQAAATHAGLGDPSYGNMAAPSAVTGMVGPGMTGFEGVTPGAQTSFTGGKGDPAGFAPGAFTGMSNVGQTTQGPTAAQSVANSFDALAGSPNAQVGAAFDALTSPNQTVSNAFTALGEKGQPATQQDMENLAAAHANPMATPSYAVPSVAQDTLTAADRSIAAPASMSPNQTVSQAFADLPSPDFESMDLSNPTPSPNQTVSQAFEDLTTSPNQTVSNAFDDLTSPNQTVSNAFTDLSPAPTAEPTAAPSYVTGFTGGKSTTGGLPGGWESTLGAQTEALTDFPSPAPTTVTQAPQTLANPYGLAQPGQLGPALDVFGPALAQPGDPIGGFPGIQGRSGVPATPSNLADKGDRATAPYGVSPGRGDPAAGPHGQVGPSIAGLGPHGSIAAPAAFTDQPDNPQQGFTGVPSFTGIQGVPAATPAQTAQTAPATPGVGGEAAPVGGAPAPGSGEPATGSPAGPTAQAGTPETEAPETEAPTPGGRTGGRTGAAPGLVGPGVSPGGLGGRTGASQSVSEMGGETERMVAQNPGQAAGAMQSDPRIAAGLTNAGFNDQQLGQMFGEIGFSRKEQNPAPAQDDSKTLTLQQPQPSFGMAEGGYVTEPGYYAVGGLKSFGPAQMRSMASQAHYSGANIRPAINPPGVHLINSSVAGRTDRIPMRTAPGSFVLPADVVSGLGQGNTNAGAKLWGQAISHSIGPMGIQNAMRSRAVRAPTAQISRGVTKGFAQGGDTDDLVPIVTAGGECLVDPEFVRELGQGDPELGKKTLSNSVLMVRKHVISHLQKLPRPVQ